MNLIGIDVHKKQSQVCVLDEQEEVCFETRVPTSRAQLKDVQLIYKRSKSCWNPVLPVSGWRDILSQWE